MKHLEENTDHVAEEPRLPSLYLDQDRVSAGLRKDTLTTACCNVLLHKPRILQILRAGLGLCSKSLQQVDFGHNLLAAHPGVLLVPCSVVTELTR